MSSERAERNATKKTNERTTPRNREPTRSSEIRFCRASFFPEHRRGSQWSKSCVACVSGATTSCRRVWGTNPHCYWHRDRDICGKGYKRRGSKRKEDTLLDPGGHCSSPCSSTPSLAQATLSGRVNGSSDSDTGRLRRVWVFAPLPFFPPLRPERACLPLAIIAVMRL